MTCPTFTGTALIERARPSRCRVRQPRLAHARSQATPAVLDVPRKEGRTMGRASVVVLMTLVAGGCGEGTPDSSRQLGDTTFVFSSSPLRGTASLREISRIGMIDGPPEYLLGMFPLFTVGPDGSLFVADGQLRHYDADGTYVRTIARRGQGPGEVRAVAGMDVSADGLLAVLGRFLRFRSLHGSVPLSFDSGIRTTAARGSGPELRAGAAPRLTRNGASNPGWSGGSGSAGMRPTASMSSTRSGGGSVTSTHLRAGTRTPIEVEWPSLD